MREGSMPIKAVGYRVSYKAQAFGEKFSSFASFRFGQAINAVRNRFMESDKIEYMMVLNDSLLENDNKGDTLELLFFVPDSPERREYLMYSINHFEKIVQTVLRQPVNTAFRTIEDDGVVDKQASNTISDPPGIPDEQQY